MCFCGNLSEICKAASMKYLKPSLLYFSWKFGECYGLSQCMQPTLDPRYIQWNCTFRLRGPPKILMGFVSCKYCTTSRFSSHFTTRMATSLYTIPNYKHPMSRQSVICLIKHSTMSTTLSLSSKGGGGWYAFSFTDGLFTSGKVAAGTHWKWRR